MRFTAIFAIICMFSISSFAQTPEKISYQAVIRDNNQKLLKKTQIDLKIVIRQSTPTGKAVYEEVHQIETNINGLVSFQIGTGNIVNQSFSDIPWSKGPFYLETLIDPTGNSNFTIRTTSQMLSVPYALHAKSADYFTGNFTEEQVENLNLYSDKDIDGHEIAFNNWDKDATDDFSGDFEDLRNIPKLYTADEIDRLLMAIEISEGTTQILNLDNNTLAISGGNSISFEHWDTNASDDFSGNYDDLINKPDLYTKVEVDQMLQNIDVDGGVAQNLNLENNTLTISGGNSISFENWDTNLSDDFSGNYDDLTNKPDLYTKAEVYKKKEVDQMLQNIDVDGGVAQNLNLENNTLSISGGNSISFENWDTNASDDFSGNYDDLINKPDLYTKVEVDQMLQNIDVDGGVAQNLNLENNTLSISGGNSISFENWDTNTSDDFSGNYDDLTNKPDFYTKAEVYKKNEVNQMLQNIDVDGGVAQNLNLENNILSISGGNSISFDHWDTNASDDFSGNYDDLTNKPDLYTKAEVYKKNEVDQMIQNIDVDGGVAQNLNLEDNTLSISGGNSISFENWDTNASDDFDGKYSSLEGAPKVYTQKEVDEIKARILEEVSENYSKKAVIRQLSSNRNLNDSDIGNTIACTNSSTLTIINNFSSMKTGEVINLEVHGTTLIIKGDSGVIVNGKSGGSKSIGNNDIYSGGIVRKTGDNSYIVL